MGSARIVTPSMDIADEASRNVVRRLQHHSINAYGDEWLGDVCKQGRMDAGEIYVLTRGILGVGLTTALRVTVRLDQGGEVIHERFPDPFTRKVIARSRRAFDASEAEAFRSLLIEGGFMQMGKPPREGSCHGETITLESCIAGRYFGVIRPCETTEEPKLVPLANAIEAFAQPPGHSTTD